MAEFEIELFNIGGNDYKPVDTTARSSATDAQILETIPVGKANWICKEDTTIKINEDGTSDFISCADCDSDEFEAYINKLISNGSITLYKEDGTAYNLPYDATYSESWGDGYFLFSNHSGDYDEDNMMYPTEITICFYLEDKQIVIYGGSDGNYDDIDRLTFKPICLPISYEDKTVTREKYMEHVESLDGGVYRGEYKLCNHTYNVADLSSTFAYITTSDITSEALNQWIALKAKVEGAGKEFYMTDNNGYKITFTCKRVRNYYQFIYVCDNVGSIGFKLDASTSSTNVFGIYKSVLDGKEFPFTSLTIDDRYVANDIINSVSFHEEMSTFKTEQTATNTEQTTYNTDMTERMEAVESEITDLSNDVLDNEKAVAKSLYELESRTSDLEDKVGDGAISCLSVVDGALCMTYEE